MTVVDSVYALAGDPGQTFLLGAPIFAGNS
jgi:hypothetical protein